MSKQVIDAGTISFSMESRVLRELGERLVKQPEVAILELIKNSYDADATRCIVGIMGEDRVSVEDDGSGMTFGRFVNGWMRIGTGLKEGSSSSEVYSRPITGEKGIGRFAVRFLGSVLHLESVAVDHESGRMTRLVAEFNWPEFDQNEDLTGVKVPYRLEEVDSSAHTGTKLVISQLRVKLSELDVNRIRTSSVDILSPLGALLHRANLSWTRDEVSMGGPRDPGFVLHIGGSGNLEGSDVASAVLDEFTLRASLELCGDRMDLRVYRRRRRKPYLSIHDKYQNSLGKLYVDIRFFPRRSGSFLGLPIDGRRAYSWVSKNSGVAVFDRRFRVLPYGLESDHWLFLDADAARNRRDPRSSISAKHFGMSGEERASTSENWMLRLPQSAQLIGLVSVEGRRAADLGAETEEGLVASADREGFVENGAFRELRDLVRGAVEAIAYSDRRLQQQEEKRRREALLSSIQKETQAAIEEIRLNPDLSVVDKNRIIKIVASTQVRAELQEEATRERERQLQVMSLLGVVAGFMTHEFGVALAELTEAHATMAELARQDGRFSTGAGSIATHIKNLKEFVRYSTGYIRGQKDAPTESYPVRPRIKQVERIFGRYASQRGIELEIGISANLMAPAVPVALYNGVSLNLYTNALKAVTASRAKHRGLISFRAWNQGKWHFLEVLDNGIGIPLSLQKRVFDPLFTTTDSRNDPLGSGMGLGLTLVRRTVESFGGRVELVEPPPDFNTCVQVRLPNKEMDWNGS